MHSIRWFKIFVKNPGNIVQCLLTSPMLGSWLCMVSACGGFLDFPCSIGGDQEPQIIAIVTWKCPHGGCELHCLFGPCHWTTRLVDWQSPVEPTWPAYSLVGSSNSYQKILHTFETLFSFFVFIYLRCLLFIGIAQYFHVGFTACIFPIFFFCDWFLIESSPTLFWCLQSCQVLLLLGGGDYLIFNPLQALQIPL